MTYTLKLRGKKYSVETLEKAAALFDSKQDLFGNILRGADVFQDGKLAARISQNGNVWPPEPWFAGQVPLIRVSGSFAL